MIDDFEKWDVSLSGKTVYLGGSLSPTGLRRVLSLVDPPNLPVSKPEPSADLPSAKVSPEIVAQGNATYQVALPTGRYRIDAADIPRAVPSPFIVGPERSSSQQDLLLP